MNERQKRMRDAAAEATARSIGRAFGVGDILPAPCGHRFRTGGEVSRPTDARPASVSGEVIVPRGRVK